jgi:hypothetical protein
MIAAASADKDILGDEEAAELEFAAYVAPKPNPSARSSPSSSFLAFFATAIFAKCAHGPMPVTQGSVMPAVMLAFLLAFFPQCRDQGNSAHTPAYRSQLHSTPTAQNNTNTTE